jgi:hypothetical protein
MEQNAGWRAGIFCAVDASPRRCRYRGCGITLNV